MKKKEKQEVLDIREDIPIRRYDKQKKCFQRENGSYSNLYQIIPRDLVNSDVDEIEMDCFKWAKFLKIYGLDIEIISMMFPCNTHTQQEYWKKRMRNNTNPLYHEMIKRKLAELEYREKHAVTKQFFIQVFFADDNERKESIRPTQCSISTPMMKVIRGISTDSTEILLSNLCWRSFLACCSSICSCECRYAFPASLVYMTV